MTAVIKKKIKYTHRKVSVAMKSVPRLRNIILPTPQAPLPFPVTTYPSPKGNHYSSLQYHGLIFELYENGIKPHVLFSFT